MTSNDWSSREPPRLGPVPPPRQDGRASAHRLDPGAPAPRQPTARHRAPIEDFGYPVDRGRSGGFGRMMVYAFLSLVALAAVGLGALVVAPPVDLVRSHVIAEVQRQTGRKLVIGGAGVSFASGLGVSLDSVALEAPQGMGGAPLLTAERIEVSLALLPLVTGDLKVDRVTLVKPTLQLRVDPEGRKNWQFTRIGRADGPLPVRYAAAPGPTTDAGTLPPEVTDFMRNASPPRRIGGRAMDALSLADVRITGGSVRYTDEKSAFGHEIRGIDATLSLPDVNGPLKVTGEMELAGAREAVELQLDDVAGLLAERSVNLRATIDGKAVVASFDGTVATGAKPFKDGKVRIKAPSAAALAAALGLPLTGTEAIGAVSIEGDLRATAESVMLSSARIAAGGSSGTGTIAVETGGARPRVVANMQLAALQLDPLLAVHWEGGLAEPASSSAADTSAPGGSAGRFAPHVGPGASAQSPQSIGDLLKRDAVRAPETNPATRVKGFRKRLGNQWEVDAINVASLQRADIEARLQIASLQSESVNIESLQTGIELKDGVLRISVTEGRLFGGNVHGIASVDARQSPMAVAINLSGDGVGLRPLLQLSGIDLVDGKARIFLAVNATGASERELVSALTGRAEFKATEGALVGWDADAIVSEAARGHMPSTERRLDARTPFRELSGSFQVTHGVARSRDLKLDSDAVSSSGTATVNIVDRNLDILLKPKLASGGLEVPVRIAGAWDAPDLVADVASVLKSPKAQEAVKQLKNGNVEGALRSVLGNGPKADKKIDKAKEMLRGLLGR